MQRKILLYCSPFENIMIKGKANLLGYCCIIDRTNKESIIKDNIISQIKLKIETYKNNELPEDLKKIQPTKPGSREFYK